MDYDFDINKLIPKIDTPKADSEESQKKSLISKMNVGQALTEKVKGLIFWIGLICSVISAVAYILIVIVMSVGFKLTASIESSVAFAVVTAFVGLLISQFLKWQGISFAKNEKEIKEAWETYYGRKSPKRKYRSLKSFWIKSIAVDIVFKATSVAIITIGTAYIFIEASGDWMRILMALFNLTLFAGFGMMSLTKAYDFTKEQHTAWMKHQTELEGAEVKDKNGSGKTY